MYVAGFALDPPHPQTAHIRHVPTNILRNKAQNTGGNPAYAPFGGAVHKGIGNKQLLGFE